MRHQIRSVLLRYGLAAAAFATVLYGSRLLRSGWGISFDPTTLIILTMIGSAWYGGFGPGLLVALLFEATLEYSSRTPIRFGILFNRIVLFGAVVVFASARRMAEVRLREQGNRLEEALARERAARAEAEAASRLKDDFLATVSHEMRTPLNTILGWATILTRHQIDEETRRKAVHAIERSANAQTRIVEDLLDFSGIVKGQLRIEPEIVALAPIVGDAVETVRLSAEAKRIALELSADQSVTVRGDPDRLQQIAWNLLANAVKFTPADGRVDIRVARFGDVVELRVSDTGIGIDGTFLPHVFEPFRQADASMTREHGGLGLGLALVRKLAELHGGTVTAESPGTNRGAVFTLRLPAAGAESPIQSRGTEDEQYRVSAG